MRDSESFIADVHAFFNHGFSNQANIQKGLRVLLPGMVRIYKF